MGVDNEPQSHYCGDEFHQADAFEFLAEHWHEVDVIHGSPVCKGYSVMNNLTWLKGQEYPFQILPLREALIAIGKPYVIENVMGARWGAKGLKRRGLEAHGMQAGWLCGQMFGLPFYRHRLFETNWLWLAPEHPKHQLNLHPRSERYVYGGTVMGKESGLLRRQNGAQAEGVGIGHAKGWRLAAAAMGITWMTRAELTQAIPPAYTEWVGRQLRHLLV